jgi:hypothetical protein
MFNVMELLIEKLDNLNEGEIHLKNGEVRMILTALKIYEAIDNVLDERLGLNK